MSENAIATPIRHEAPHPFRDTSAWRLHMAKRIASELDAEKYGVRGVYLFGSTEYGDAGNGSDIDLIVHVDGTSGQCSLLREWFAGWDKALCALNELLTGLESPFLLDIHYITEQDIRDKECFAAKIDSIHEPATPLRVG